MPELFIADQAGLFERLEPVIHVLVNLVLGEAVALLQLAFELLAAALDHVEIVVGEFTPLFLGLSLELLPIAFDPVPIHRHLLLSLRWPFQRPGSSNVPGLPDQPALASLRRAVRMNSV